MQNARVDRELGVVIDAHWAAVMTCLGNRNEPPHIKDSVPDMRKSVISIPT